MVMDNHSYQDRDVSQIAADKAAQFADKATAGLDMAMNKAADLAADATKHGRQVGQQVEEVAGHLKGALDRSITDQPMTTLAVVAAFGFVLGALWKS
jgi:ElaB/YqjD/DUF883 family membrane-anchored ribosome-binding protein